MLKQLLTKLLHKNKGGKYVSKLVFYAQSTNARGGGGG